MKDEIEHQIKIEHQILYLKPYKSKSENESKILKDFATTAIALFVNTIKAFNDVEDKALLFLMDEIGNMYYK